MSWVQLYQPRDYGHDMPTTFTNGNASMAVEGGYARKTPDYAHGTWTSNSQLQVSCLVLDGRCLHTRNTRVGRRRRRDDGSEMGLCFVLNLTNPLRLRTTLHPSALWSSERVEFATTRSYSITAFLSSFCRFLALSSWWLKLTTHLFLL